MKKFIELEENATGNNFLKIETHYNLGGYNVFTYKAEQRGYYLSISPVKIENSNGVQFESYTAFSGVKICILEVSRKSKKAEERAEDIATEKENELINYICTRHGLKVKRP